MFDEQNFQDFFLNFAIEEELRVFFYQFDQQIIKKMKNNEITGSLHLYYKI